MTVINSFYTPFDKDDLGSRSADSYRTPFQQDRDRVVHTSAFRRLQAKTQVFKSGEYDFYRTRLTHSLEVAQVGRSICCFLKQNSPDQLSPDFHIDEDLVEACCLAHDIGHPPFGHAGESSLNRLMKSYGGFEGNAQTLRLLTETIFSDGAQRQGMSPTRAFVDGVLKYKTIWSDANPPSKEFIYSDQSKYLEFVANGKTSIARNDTSIECQIMNWADDTAYSLGDLMDGVRATFITIPSLERWCKQKENETLIAAHDNCKALNDFCCALQDRKISRHIAMQYGKFIQATSLKKRPSDNMGVESNRYRFQLEIDPICRSQYGLFKRIARDLVFYTPKVHQLEHKANMMLEQMFRSYEEHYWGSRQYDKPALRLLPSDTHKAVVDRAEVRQRARLICDHISGMSDDFAVFTYKRMFEAGFGSFVDLV